MKIIKLNLANKSYRIIIGKGVLSSLESHLKNLDLGRVAVVVTNPIVNRLYGKRIKQIIQQTQTAVHFVQMPDSEKSKSMPQALRLIKAFTEQDRGRGVFAVALGGGVIGDLTGFAAAIYRRGIPYIQLPTTLLAQVDSSIGGKVAVDLQCGKNLVGSFYQPRLVISEIDFLKTLKITQIRQALAEIIKYGIIADEHFFEFLENNLEQVLKLNPQVLQHIIEVCASIKARIVEQDETDMTGQRMVLNLGHTTAHALEAASGYQRSYSHGEAVGLGILVACELAKLLKLISDDPAQRIQRLIERTGLPTQISGLPIEAILKSQAHDKKFDKGKNRFLLPKGIGKVIIKEGIPEDLISRAIKKRMQ